MDTAFDGPLDRALAIIDFVAVQKKAVAISEIANALGLPTPSAHRLIGNLEDRGLLQRSLGSKRLVLGNKMLLLGAKAIGAGFRTARRHSILQQVSREIGEQCEIGVVRGTLVTYVDSVRVTPAVGLQFDPGVNVPLHCTSTGKIYLGQVPRPAREKLVRSLELHGYTERTITSPKKLLVEAELARERGWTKSNEEYVRGVAGCAVPIYGPDRLLIACLGISVPVARISFDELDIIVPTLQSAAERLSTAIVEDESDAGGDVVRSAA